MWESWRFFGHLAFLDKQPFQTRWFVFSLFVLSGDSSSPILFVLFLDRSKRSIKRLNWNWHFYFSFRTFVFPFSSISFDNVLDNYFFHWSFFLRVNECFFYYLSRGMFRNFKSRVKFIFIGLAEFDDKSSLTASLTCCKLANCLFSWYCLAIYYFHRF